MSIKNIKSQLNDKLTFLIACCQTEPSKDDMELIHSYINNKDLVTNTLIELANQHAILPLIYKTLKELSKSDSTLDTDTNILLINFKSTYTQIAQRNMLMSAELIRIMKLLEKNDIEVLAFKGPALSQMVYGDITLRQYVDLDILVDERNIYYAGELLKNNNHVPIGSLTLLNDEMFLYISKDFSFMSQSSNVHTELHWKLFDKSLCIKQTAFSLFQEYQNVSINKQLIKTFSNEDYILFLCLHGSKHYWERIGWIVDVDKLIRTFPNLNWNKVLQNARTTGTVRMLILGLSLSHELFHTPLNKMITNEIQKDKKLQEIKQKVLDNYLSLKSNDSYIEKFTTFFEQVSLRENISTKLLSFFYLLFYPKSNDIEWIKLPQSLFFLYWIIHPIRILYHKFFPKNH